MLLSNESLLLYFLYVLVFQQVKALIQEALLVFDADKTGIADYALESSGESLSDISVLKYCHFAYSHV